MRQRLRTKAIMWWSKVLIRLDYLAYHVKAWWYYYKRNRYIRKVSRAMRRSCEAWGRLTGEMYLSGLVIDGATRAFLELAQALRAIGITEEGAV